MNLQRISAVARQVVAVAAIVMGALTSALSSIHLPPAVSSVLAAAGAILLAVEHYVGDPSTGATPLTTAVGKVESVETSVESALKTLTAAGHTVTVTPAPATPPTP